MTVGYECKHCGGKLYWDDLDYGICVDCVEVSIERKRQRAEWNEYHDEPCPEIELTPYPNRKPRDLSSVRGSQETEK